MMRTAPQMASPGWTLVRILTWVGAVVITAGCATLGPSSIQRDRVDYAGVLAVTWKEQTLLNIVKLRYGDIPVYLDVSSVISSSSVESQVNVGASWFSEWSNGGNGQTLGAYGRYTDRPTISYTPLSGEKFSRYLLRPLSPASVFSLVQAGYPVDRVVQLTTRGINGVYNRSASPARARAADPAFYRLLDTWRRIQLSESLGMRIERRGADELVLLVFPGTVSADVGRDIVELTEILKLRSRKGELTLTFGMVPRNDSEIAILTRSMVEIFLEVAATIDAPPAHLQEGRANPPPPPPAQPNRWDEPLVRIQSGTERPTDAYAAVHYQNYWFWIDDRDLRSKTEFTFMLVLFSLAETGVAPQAPVITIPAN